MPSKKILRSGAFADFFCDGVQRGSTITLAGQIGVDQSGNTPRDLKGQVMICYENIKRILTEFGADLDDVIDETWFVTDMQECMTNVTDIFALREEIFGRKPEVSQTLVGVAALVDPKLKVEIKCIAHLGSNSDSERM